MKNKAFNQFLNMLFKTFLSLFSIKSPFFFDSPFLIEDSDYLDLYVKTSNIPNSGLGLFTKRAFSPREILGEYRGPVIKGSDSNLPIFDNESNFLELNEGDLILGRSIVSFANDCIDLQLEKFGSEEYKVWVRKRIFPNRKGCEYNSEIRFQGNKAFLYTKEEIQEGKEVFMDYGFPYWKAFYENYKENQ